MKSREQQANGQTARRRARRGAIYVLVLGASMVLLLIGLSAISLSRAAAYNTSQSNDWLDAQAFCVTACDHALTKINADDNWRATYNGVTVRQTIGDRTFSWRVVDEQDGDLTDNAADPAVLLVTSTAGKSTYAMRLDLEVTSGSGSAGTSLYGVDSTDGTLFAATDYNRLVATMTRFGQLKWSDNGVIRNVGAGIKGMAILPSGDAFMVLNADLGSRNKPVLLKYNLKNATSSGNNVVTVVGSIPWGKEVTGLAYDTTSMKLYALGLDTGNKKYDRLLVLNQNTAAISQNVGAMSGAGQSVDEGCDMVIDDSGNLYVADAADRHLYSVDKATAAITGMPDDTLTGSGTMAALAWDAHGQKLLGANTTLSILYWITLRNRENIVLNSFWLCGLDTVQAMGFIPGSSGGGGGLVVRPALSGASIKRTVQ